jgi:hypothetical protein
LCLATQDSGIDLALLDGMPNKDFTDASGMGWRVWNTVPISGAVINPGFEKGWLTFESDMGALRRLAPIPDGWDELPTEKLIELLRQSREVPRHTGPMRRVVVPGIDADSADRR